MALIESLNTGVSTIKAFSNGMKVVGNNIANVNSVGFKSSRVEYSDSFSNSLQRSAPNDGGNGSNQVSKQIGTGVNTQVVSANFNQGPIEESGIGTDMAITGQGFFTVRDAVNGENFVTRAGNFRVDDRGYVVNSDGFRLRGLTGGAPPATAPSALGDIQIAYTPVNSGDPTFDNFTINTQGDVIFQLSDGSSFTSATILLQRFLDPQALNAEGNGLYSGIDSAGAVGGTALTLANNEPGTNGLGKIRAGALELSNTDLTQEFANIIVAQRSFQAGARVVTVSDSIIEEIVNLKR